MDLTLNCFLVFFFFLKKNKTQNKTKNPNPTKIEMLQQEDIFLTKRCSPRHCKKKTTVFTLKFLQEDLRFSKMLSFTNS